MQPHHRYARLAREGDRLRWGQRWFGQGTDFEPYELVDTHDHFVLSLIGDKSIVLEEPPALRPEAEGGQPTTEPAAAEPADAQHPADH